MQVLADQVPRPVEQLRKEIADRDGGPPPTNLAAAARDLHQAGLLDVEVRTINGRRRPFYSLAQRDDLPPLWRIAGGGEFNHRRVKEMLDTARASGSPLTPAEVAADLDVHRDTARRMIKAAEQEASSPTDGQDN